MRVLLLSEVFPPVVGGSGELLYNVYRRLHGDVHVHADVVPGAPRLSREENLTIERRPMHARYWGGLSWHGLRHHLHQARVVRNASRAPGTVVHCARALPEGVGAWLSRLSGGAPYVCWAHGEDVASATTSRELTFLMRKVYEGASAVIANSRSTASMLALVGYDPTRVEVVHPGVDGTRFRPGIVGSAELRARLVRAGELLVLTVARLQRRKGHDRTLEALSVLVRRGVSVRYVVVGSGEERDNLEALASALGVRNRVVFEGAVPSDALPAYFAAADVFCHPNREDHGDIEGFGIVFLEAAAAEVPVIGGNSGGVPEAVDDGVTGLLVSGSDVVELADCIAELAHDPERRRQLGRAGRKRALRDFTWDRAADRVAAIHARVAATSRTAPPRAADQLSP